MLQINRQNRWIRIASAALSVVLLASLPALAGKKSQKKEAQVEALATTAPAIPGPKRTVAVADFNNKTDFLLQYGQVDVGGGLAAMLTTALVESGQFIVVERARLSSVLSEQELAAAGMAPHGSPMGQLLGAQLMIMGSVTEFSQSAKGKGFGIGFGSNGRRLGLAGRSRTGTVGLDIRVIDTVSSEVVASYSVRESVKAKAVGLNFADGDFNLSHSNFKKTPIGQAARKAIGAAVLCFAQEAASRPWAGQVVDFDSMEVAINAGASSGIHIGDSFDVFRVSKVLTDPATGRVIGQRKRAIGTVVIGEVDENVAFGAFQGQSLAPQRGDIVAQP